MKNLKMMVCMWVLAASTVGCSSAYYASGGYVDDMYGTHDQVAIARKRQAKAEAEKAAAEARKAEWEARIAEARAAAAEQEYYANPYDEVLADTYESAYARRLRGFESPTYRLPSSYYNFRYGGAFNYVTAYDPAFYNIVVSGDQVWVEPKYITSMFGAWGGSVVYADPWYWGWNYGPYYRPWNFGLSIGSWGWSLGWNNWYDPWHYGWNSPWWGPGWGPAWAPGHGPGHVHGKPYAPNIVRRPSPYVSPSGGRHYGSRPGNGASSFNRNATRFDFGVRGNAAQPGGRGNATYDRGVGSGGSRGSGVRNNRGGSTTFSRGGAATPALLRTTGAIRAARSTAAVRPVRTEAVRTGAARAEARPAAAPADAMPEAVSPIRGGFRAGTLRRLRVAETPPAGSTVPRRGLGREGRRSGNLRAGTLRGAARVENGAHDVRSPR